MPIYAYKCTDCGCEKEVLQKISDAPLVDCPECGHASMAKQVTAAGFQLKGSGWYATDFRNKDSGKGGKTDSKIEGGSDSKSDSTSDSKADSKADTKPDSKAQGATAASTPAASSHTCGSGGCGSCS